MAGSRTRTQAQNKAFDNLADQAVQGNALELAVGGKGDQTLHGGENDEREPPGITGNYLAGALAFCESSSCVSEGFFAGLQQLTRGTGPVFCLEHQSEQS